MTIFINNKYTKWYNNLIDHRRQNIPDGYVEKHHIIPKCLGGSNDYNNLVSLTAREHVVAHWLLTKMVDKHSQYKMGFALGAMLRSSGNQSRKLTPIEAARCKESKSISMKAYAATPEVRERRAAYNANPEIKAQRSKLMKMVQNRPDVKAKRAKTNAIPEIKRKWTESMAEVNSRPEVQSKRRESIIAANARPEVKAKRKDYNDKPETKIRQSCAAKESQNRPEVRAKKSEKAKANYLNPEIREKYIAAAIEAQNRPEVKALKSARLKSDKKTCPHCNKVGVGPAMNRHHFNRCKMLLEHLASDISGANFEVP